MCMVFEEFRTAQILKGASLEAAKQMQATLESLMREFNAGVSVHSEHTTTVGKKPS